MSSLPFVFGKADAGERFAICPRPGKKGRRIAGRSKSAQALQQGA